MNSKTDARNSFIDRKDKHVWVKYRFRYYTNLGAFGIRNGGGASNTNPNLIHLRIKYKNKHGKKKQYNIIRRPTWKSNKKYEKKLWKGFVKSVYEVDVYMENTKKRDIRVSQISLYK